jgi:dTDP-4-amino-4,6-dideoxygalactose transaminase
LAEVSSPKSGLPVAEMVADKVISLPFHPYLSDSDIKRITKILNEAVS